MPKNIKNNTPKGKKLTSKNEKALIVQSWNDAAELSVGLMCLWVYSVDEKGQPQSYEMRRVTEDDFEDAEG